MGAKTITDLYGKDDISVSGTSLCTQTANVHLLLDSERPQFAAPIDLWIVEDIDAQPLDLFFKYIVPAMMMSDGRVLMTHFEETDSLKILKRTFHCLPE